jgi:hypothetical protein
MLRFRTAELHVDAAELITQRFTRLVTRLLPSGWRFTITPTPRMETTTMCSDLAPSSCSTAGRVIEGAGALEHWDTAGTRRGEAWQEQFLQCMRRLTQSSQVSTFWLVDRREDVWFDDYHTRRMDVADFESTTPRDAAAGLVHAWEEDLGTGDIRPAEIAGRYALTSTLRINAEEFELNHMLSIYDMEAQVMGGIRQESRCRSRPAGVSPSIARPGQRYEYWIPYQLSGGSIRAVIMRLEGGTVIGSRMAEFPSMEEFDRAATRS